jgi:hypothetical protein
MKQEKVEEIAHAKHRELSTAEIGIIPNFVDGFVYGIKRQQEKMYSEEEVLDILYKHTEDLLAGKKISLEEWFEKFKK